MEAIQWLIYKLQQSYGGKYGHYRNTPIRIADHDGHFNEGVSFVIAENNPTNGRFDNYRNVDVLFELGINADEITDDNIPTYCENISRYINKTVKQYKIKRFLKYATERGKF